MDVNPIEEYVREPQPTDHLWDKAVKIVVVSAYFFIVAAGYIGYTYIANHVADRAACATFEGDARALSLCIIKQRNARN